MGSASSSSGASQKSASSTSAIPSISMATAARNNVSGQVITNASSFALTCGEVRRVTNATRPGDRRLSESSAALKFLGSLMGFRSPCVETAVFADAPEMYAYEQKCHERQNHAVQHIKSQQCVSVHR